MSSLLNVTDILTAYGYVGIFVIIFIESGVFFFLPGDSLLFAAGLLSATGHLNLFLILVPAIIAAFFGNTVGYEIGAHLEKLRKNGLFKRIVKDEHVEEANRFFDKHGRTAILLARFAPAVRTFTPWVAGAAQMDRRNFSIWSAAGAFIWVLVMTLAGYFLGRAFPGIEKYLTETMIVIIVISILPGAIGYLKHRRSQRSKTK